MADEGRRVRDRWTGDLGTVVAYLGSRHSGLYQVAWDDPTPNEKASGVEG